MRHAFVLTLALTVLAVASTTPLAQEDPFQSLRQYDFQNRTALDAVHKQIQAAGKDPAKLAAIETKLIAVLQDPAATFAARQEVCKFLSFMGTARSVPALAAMLAKDRREADAARYALEHIPGPEAAAALRKALPSSSRDARIGIINSLGARRDAAAVASLRSLLPKADPATRLAVVHALGRIGTEAALTVLTSAKPRDLPVCQALIACVAALAKAGKAAPAIPVLTSLTKTGTPPPARIAALRAMMALRHPATAATALTLLRDSDSFVQKGAAAVLGRMPSPAAVRLVLSHWAELSAEAKTVLLHAWADTRQPLIAETAVQVAKTASGDLRRAAIAAAARCAGPKAVPILVEIAAGGSEEAEAARMALETISGAGVQEALLRLAREGRPEVRAAVIRALAQRPGKGSREAILQAAGSDNETVALAALGALNAIGTGEETDVLLQALQTAPSDNVRTTAAQVLVATISRASNRAAAVARVLQTYASTSTPVRVALLQVFAEVRGPEALEELRKAAASSDPELKRAAVQALANTWSDGTARPVLLQLAKSDADRPIRILALRGLIRLIAQDGSLSDADRVAALDEAAAIAERPEEKRQILGALRDCRIETAVALAARFLQDADLFADAAETILDLAAPQRRNNRDLPPVKGATTTAALDRIIELAQDLALRERAAKLK